MQKTNVGSVEIAGLVDAHFAFPAENIHPEAGDALSNYSDLIQDGNLALICACFLIRADGQTVLVDTGLGAGGEGGLIKGLGELGVQPGDVNTVVFTHLHGDHTGWTMEDAQIRFSNARHWVPQGDYDHFKAEGADNFKRDIAPLEAAGQLELFSGEKSYSESLTLVPTPGHTPGHTSIAVSSGGQRAFVLGDVAVSAISLTERDWKVMFDGDAATAAATRHKVLSELEQSGDLVASSHFGPDGLGRFAKSGNRTVWQPL